MRKKAFTLIELLVVIAIVGLLLSVILPAMHRVKLLSTAAVCLSSICQLAISWQSYSSENKNQIVYGHVLYTSVPDTTRCFEVHFLRIQSGDYLGEAAALKCEYERIGMRKES